MFYCARIVTMGSNVNVTTQNCPAYTAVLLTQAETFKLSRGIYPVVVFVLLTVQRRWY